MDWIAFARRYGFGAVALVVAVGHSLLDLRREAAEDKALALLQRRLAVVEARPLPQDTRFGQEMDRRVDRLESIIFSPRYTPPPTEYSGP